MKLSMARFLCLCLCLVPADSASVLSKVGGTDAWADLGRCRLLAMIEGVVHAEVDERNRPLGCIQCAEQGGSNAELTEC